MKKEYIGLLVLLFCVATLAAAFAEPRPNPPKAKVDTNWERKADKNGDGIVERAEARTWKDADHRPKVNNPVEAKYDANHDGWLEPAESKQMLKDKYEVIKTDGKAKVNTQVEAQYDANNDGIIDAQEAKIMLRDLN